MNQKLPTPEEFKKMAVAFTKKATKTKKTARDYLQKEGIIDKKGNLTKNYQQPKPS